MADVEFERRLERLFGEAIEFPDSTAFAGGVERRLNAGWTARRWLIGAAGVAGGVIGASQLIMANVAQRIETASGSAKTFGEGISHAKMLTAGFSQFAPRADWLSTFASGGLGLWVAMGLAVVGMGFALTRVIEEL